MSTILDIAFIVLVVVFGHARVHMALMALL
jgi:hypothetical protein